jgi:ATP-dependent DNA helicase RecQ
MNPSSPADIDILLQDRFGLSRFRPGQRQVIADLRDGGAALAVFPTGGGKSLCYQLPALLFEGVTVVVSPLIALMKDQIDHLRQLGIDAARLDSSLSAEDAADVSARLRSGALRLLYVAPERFNNERFLDQLRETRISLFAVDEAHCISEWGHNFRPDYLKLAGISREVRAERVLALTATATPAVVQDICTGFGIPPGAATITGFHRPNLRLLTSPSPARSRKSELLRRLRARPPGPGIVYVTLQKTAERVAAALAEAGIPARAYHAGMEAGDRAAVQEWWKSSADALVVATIAFGMGIDKSDVRYVYHYNLPKSLESYSQEIGRAGRDDEPAIVEMLGSREDSATLANFAYGDTPAPESLGSLLREIAALPPRFDVSLYALSMAHDIRPLVLRTALTYLELLGVLRQETPFYAAYRALPRTAVEEIIERFGGERAEFLRGIFGASRKGREWYTVDPAAVADQLRQPRQRVVAALDYLAVQQLIELRPADARQRYTRLVDRPDVERLVGELAARFGEREAREIDRIRRVEALVVLDSCQTNSLLEYFGEQRDEPCGHCSFCETGRASVFPTDIPLPPISSALDLEAFGERCVNNSAALGLPRQQARFLCGLSSPALSRARLTRDPLFGALEHYDFPAVLHWCHGR